MCGANDDDNVGWFGFVSLQAIRIGGAPVGETTTIPIVFEGPLTPSSLDLSPASIDRAGTSRRK